MILNKTASPSPSIFGKWSAVIALVIMSTTAQPTFVVTTAEDNLRQHQGSMKIIRPTKKIGRFRNLNESPEKFLQKPKQLNSAGTMITFGDGLCKQTGRPIRKYQTPV
jgi:hypothetical protein